MATYVLKRKSYAVVRNPYIERRVIPKSSDENESELLDNPNTPELNKQVKKMRNETPVYQNLDKDKKTEGSTVFITDYGTNYHGKLGCSKLKRTVHKVHKSEVDGKNLCSKCKGEGT
jgi:hypothetical protein